MFRPLARSHRRPHRRGTSFVLIVVVMISFAAAVGVAFALFAGQTLRINRANLEGQGGSNLQQVRAPEPNNTINRVLSALIFGVGDDSNEDVTNAFRGHDFAHSMYGRDMTLFANGQYPTTPWAGVGTFREDVRGVANRAEVVNYTIGRLQNQTLLLDPEYQRERGFSGPGGTRDQFVTTDAAGNVTVAAGRQYVGKHAGYSFPDLKDFFLASVDASSGQVTVPSFYRAWLFGSLDPTNGQPGVAPAQVGTNNWFNEVGRLKLLRPRPGGPTTSAGVPLNTNWAPEHPRFPRVGANADGTYTGDVQNWPGGYTYAVDPATANTQTPVFRHYARNDSLWMYPGLPAVQFGNRKVVPMVAPLIVPLNGLFNASAHGNLYGPPLPPPPPDPNSPPPPPQPPTHLSNAGIGPWEVNMINVLGYEVLANGVATGSDFANVVRARPSTNGNTNATSRSYDPYRPLHPNPMAPPPTLPNPLPNYAQVPWVSGTPTGFGPLNYPTNNDLRGEPNFTGAGYHVSNANMGGHPSLHNPTEWGATGGIYPLSDIKRLHLRYAFTPDWYAASQLARTAPNALLGGNVSPFVYATGIATANSYRLDSAHTNRALFTTIGFDLDRPKVTPNFANHAPLALGTNPLAPTKPGLVYPQAYPQPGGTGTFTDFAGPNRWVNAMAALGSVDLNRPLEDYRPNTAAPLSPTNISPVQPLPDGTTGRLADYDRRKLAGDIFTRFVVALGAGATVNPTNGALTVAVAPGNGQYDALCYLAQLSVNIVDYIDDDDVSTVFVWNPNTTTPPIPPNGVDFANPADVDNRVVFGAEKTRLVVNEVYSEIVNDPMEPNGKGMNKGQAATLPGRVRFWVELLNPSNTPYPAGSTGGVLGDGAVQLYYPGGAAAPGGFSPYQLEITRGGPGGADALTQTNNVTGRLAGVPDLRYTFSNADIAGNPVKQRVMPNINNGVPQPPPYAPATGMAIVGPTVTDSGVMPQQEFDPTRGMNVQPPWADMIRVPSPAKSAPAADALEYTVPPGTDPGQLGTVNLQNPNEVLRRHTILLRRLANPYVAPNPATDPSNLFVTVDYMDHVPTNDGLLTGRGMVGLGGRVAYGKVQPYAALADPDPPVGMALVNFTFPRSMVLGQRAPGGASGPTSTFGRHNSVNGQQPAGSTFNPAPPAPPTLGAGNSDTLMTPFDWLVHMDRPLINKIELFQVRDSKPHTVTQEFVVPDNPAAPTAVAFDRGYGRWRQLGDGLARGLEFLSTRSHVAGVPHGGRVPGQININAIPDRRILNGLLDPQSGNAFATGTVPGDAWTKWMASRSQVTTNQLPNGSTVDVTRPGQSLFDGAVTPGPDRPFLSFGAPAANPGTFAYAVGSNEDLTIVRRDPTTGLPYLYHNPQAPAAAPLPPGDFYTPPEAVRKIMNNVTTVNHNYLVFLTISYFEIDTETLNPVTNQKDGLFHLEGTPNGTTMPRLAQEAYLYVPGDLRQKVMAVVDMSNMGIDPTNGQPARQPYFTTLETTARPGANVTLNIANTGGSVFANGQAVAVGNKLVLGYGIDEQIVDVTPGPGPGQFTLTTPTQLTKPVWAGSSVSNMRAGYPGVQGALFDYNDPKYRPVVPFVQRVK